MENIKPQKGDTLIIERVTRPAKTGTRAVRLPVKEETFVANVYEDYRVASRSGDVYDVKLKTAATDTTNAIWVTVG